MPEPELSAVATPGIPPLRIGSQMIRNRLLMGSGRFDSYEQMRQSLDAGDADVVTIAIRRERLHDSSGRNILDFIDLDRFRMLPNTAGCYDARTAVRYAAMGREIMQSIQPSSANWVKLEVLGDSQSLLPDPVETLKATEILVAEGFDVLCYTSDDPVLARRLKEAGAASVMPAASPIGSGLGILNPVNLGIIIEDLKRTDPDYPVIIDAGIGTASDAARGMECGADAILMNSAIARADNPIQMAAAMSMAVKAGFLCKRAGRIPVSRFGSASSPEIGVISTRPRTGELG